MPNSRRTWWWLALAVVVVALVLDLRYRPEHIGIDFHTYLAAASVGLQQGWQHIYDQALVAAAQKQLVPNQSSQPFLSPPTVSWLVAPLTPLPYSVAYGIWAALTFVAFAAALAWSSVSAGISRWVAVIAALATWWVVHAMNAGQVVPLVAAGVVVAWRLLREDLDILAGVVLSVILLKPNTAILVPFALLVAGRYRAFAGWLAAGAVVVLIAFLLLGSGGLFAYVNQLRGPLPNGAADLTLTGAIGVTGFVAFALRVVIVGAVLATAFRLRGMPGLVVPVGVIGSLIVSPYLHGSDLCLLAASSWMIWEERPVLAWRAPLAVGWILASPFLYQTGLTPNLNRWPWLEFLLLLALVVVAWRPFTATADLRTRAPA
ncbi:MAG TPA: glycosyltransferase family 87 protein [Candidatus Dormibacteraeota bacterium]|nr:glycosyltransferase family 87 protein [Candidatus Dormibacteraeota bacterium]